MTSGGAARQQFVECFANQQFRFRVHAGSGFIKNQKARIVCQRARKVDQLALSDGKCRTAFVDRRCDSFR